MYFPTTRVLTVLELLQSHQQLSGPELAERLEVNIRTVRRYITMLQDLGIPVEGERGRHGSYRLRPGFKLPPLMFSEDEALALTLGLLTARRLGLTFAAPAVEGALAKIERVLPSVLLERIRAVQETLILDVTPSGVTPPTEIVSLLSTAAQQRRGVEMRYQSWHSEITERTVDIYSLVYRSGFWYAVAYCHLRQALRVFRLDRVVDVRLLEDTFIRPEDFNSASLVASSIAMTPATWSVEVLLETTLDEAQNVIPATLATLEQSPYGVIFRCNVDDLDWIARFLSSLGYPFIVRQPSELRQALLRLAEDLTRIAERSEEDL